MTLLQVDLVSRTLVIDFRVLAPFHTLLFSRLTAQTEVSRLTL